MKALRLVPADRLGGGFADFRVREDLAASYERVRDRALALGGVVTSSGGLRHVSEPATPGRSRTSLHYTARAIDLYIESGMRSARDPYAIIPTVSGRTVRWSILCESRAPRPDDPLYEASLIRTRTVECAIWRAGRGYALASRRGAFFSLSDLFEAEGWMRIPARGDWKTNYLSCEWWHFQNETGLADGVSRFGAELREIWPEPQVAASGLALDAVWSGQSFRAAPAPAQPIPGDEKTRWIQAVLNAGGERLTADGMSGARTTAALRRFQERNELPVTGTCDAVTEIALVQRSLEALGNTPLPAIGTRDAITVQAIKAFQRSVQLTADAVMGPNTRHAMVEGLGQRRPQLPAPAPSRRRVTPR